MPDIVSFHALTRKFLEQDKDLPSPEASRQVMYYSLAIGHHVGVIDCLKQVFTCPVAEYRDWIDQLPDGEAHRKMAGLLTFGEIYIDISHAGLLGNALSGVKDQLAEPHATRTIMLMELLSDIVREPAMYVMVRLLPEAA